MEIQSVYAFKKDGFTTKILYEWLVKNDLTPIKNAHYIGDSIRFRIKNLLPNKKYVTKILPNKIRLVLMS